MSGNYDGDYLESWNAFRARAATAALDLRAAPGRAQTALAFTSGGLFAAGVGELLDLDAGQRRHHQAA